MKRFNLHTIFRVLVCFTLALVMLAPFEADGAKKKRRKATTTATTRKRTSSRSTSSRRTSQQPTVTQETQNAAITASQKKTPTVPQKSSGLTKITVEKPDLEKIRISTLDPANKFYFPKLMNKYLQKDTTMTPEEYRYLYLGYMFQEDYDPYRSSPYSVRTDSMRNKEKYTNAELDTIVKYLDLSLKDNPFDLRQMSFLVHVLKQHRKNMRAKIWEYRLENLLGAIKSTGTGEDADNAWYVIYPMHEYDMIQLLGYEAVDVDYIEPGIDNLVVQPDGSVQHRNPVSGFYFNVLVPQQQYMLKHPDDVEDDVEEED